MKSERRRLALASLPGVMHIALKNDDMKTILTLLTVATNLLSLSAISQSKAKSSDATSISTEITTELAGSPWFALDEVNMDNALNYTVKAYNTSTGIWFNGARDPWDMRPRPGNGIYFAGNGDFEICKFVNSGMGGLKSYSFYYMKGKAKQTFREITLYPSRHRNMYYSTSDPSLNYDKELARTVTKFNWTVTKYENHWEQLNVSWADGTISTFYRKW